MKDSEVVEKAIDILDEKGWCQGTSQDPDGRVCVGEALVQAITSNTHAQQDWFFRLPPMQGLRFQTLCARIASEATYVHVWNDQSGRNIDQVRDRLTTVAKELRNEGL